MIHDTSLIIDFNYMNKISPPKLDRFYVIIFCIKEFVLMDCLFLGGLPIVSDSQLEGNRIATLFKKQSRHRNFVTRNSLSLEH